MDKDQARVLYREFLFRMVDRELLSSHAQGDANKFLGRLAAFLVWISIPFTALSMGVRPGAALGPEHTLIATTMLTVAIFAVLAWDSLFPDRRDILILIPLGVKPLTIFAAKLASLAVALSVAVALFNGLPGLAFPLALMPRDASILDMLFSIQLYRNLLGYWATMFLAGGFILGCVVCLQAAVSLLPRGMSLRLSSLLQIATFCTAVCVYFLQPSLASLQRLDSTATQSRMEWLPSYWFLGLLQQLTASDNGHANAALSNLAERAWLAVGIVATLSVLLLLACFGALRAIAEQPDVAPGRRKRLFTVSLGSTPLAAIVQWTVRTLLRSRQHRVLVTFYSGVGFAAIILFVQTPVAQIMARANKVDPWRDLSLPLTGASFVMTVCWIVGVRAAFGIPIELRANWIFRLALNNGPSEPLAAARVSLLAAGVAPILVVSALVFFWLWPPVKAMQHLAVLALGATTLAAVCLRRFCKLPFACSYLPGVSQTHLMLAVSAMLGLNTLFWAANYERVALFDTVRYFQLLGILSVAVAAAWWMIRSETVPPALNFDDVPEPAIMSLGIQGDGAPV